MKTKRLFTILLCVFCGYSVYAQPTFEKQYTNGGITQGYNIKQTNDGGYIISGTSENIGAGIRDVYVIKTDSAGDTLWTRSYGGTGYDEGFSIEQTSDSGYIVSGYSTSFGTGPYEVYLIKTTIAGDTLWTKTYGGNLNGTGYSVKQTSDHGYIIAGAKVDVNGIHDVLLIKTNVTGDTLWTKTFGGGGDDYGYSVTESFDSGYVIAGNYSTGGIYLVKTNTNGDTLWTKGYIVEGPAHINLGYSIQQTVDSGYMVSGVAYGANGMEGVALKTDIDGNFTWAKTYSGASHLYLTSSVQTTDGGYIFSGWSQSFPIGSYKSLLIRTDANGDTLWTKNYGGGSSVSSVQQATDGGFVLLAADNFNIYLIKTDSLGNTACHQNNAWPVVTAVVAVNSTITPSFTSGGTVRIPATQIDYGGTVTTLCTAVGMSEPAMTENEFSIYPNPANTSFIIATDASISNSKIEIFNALGEKVMMESGLNTPSKEIFLRRISPGIYFVKLTAGEKSQIRKLIVQ